MTEIKLIDEQSYPHRTLRLRYNEYSKEISIAVGQTNEMHDFAEVDISMDEAKELSEVLQKVIRENE